MKHKGFSIYLKERRRANGKTYLEYRIVPPKHVKWPRHISKSGEGLRTEALTYQHAMSVVDRIDRRQYLLDMGLPVNSEEPIADLFAEYRKQGAARGRNRKTGWSPKYQADAKIELERWRLALKLKTVSDLNLRDLNREAVRMMQPEDEGGEGLAGSTVNTKVAYLTGFCGWAQENHLLDSNPLLGWKPMDRDSEVVHGALSAGEIRSLLAAVTSKRRIIYGLAYFCRLRRKTIASFKVRQLDIVRKGLQGRRMDIKSRNPLKTFIPLPEPLFTWIWEDCQGRGLDEPLTSISRNHAIKYFRRDLKRAGIHLEVDGVQRTFHGLGASTVTNLEQHGGASEFAIADLAGHGNVNTTRIYMREREKRIRGAQQILINDVFADWHRAGTPPEATSQALARNELEWSGWRDSNSGPRAPPKRGTARKILEPLGNGNFHSNPNKAGTPEKTPVKLGNEILARVWHHLADPKTALVLRQLLDLSPDELKALANSRSKGRAQA